MRSWLRSKESTCQCGRCRFNPWIRKIPWRRAWQPTPVFLSGESHGQRSLAGCSPWGRRASELTEQLSAGMCEILGPRSGVDPTPLALEGEVDHQAAWEGSQLFLICQPCCCCFCCWWSCFWNTHCWEEELRPHYSPPEGTETAPLPQGAKITFMFFIHKIFFRHGWETTLLVSRVEPWFDICIFCEIQPQCSAVLRSLQCLTLCDPVDCSPPGSFVHGISQARIWSGLPCPLPGDLPDPGIKPTSPVSPTLQGDSLLLSHWGSDENTS